MTCPPHHMVIATPDGNPTVRGACKRCGFTRIYGASEEAALEIGGLPYSWEGSITLKRPRKAKEPAIDARTCGVCGRVFATHPGKSSHERTCAAGELKCPECGGVRVTKASKRCRNCAAKANMTAHNARRKAS